MAQNYGGGGHIRAAGLTFEGTIGEAKAEISKALEAEIVRSNDEK